MPSATFKPSPPADALTLKGVVGITHPYGKP